MEDMMDVRINRMGYRRDRLNPNDIIYNSTNTILHEPQLPVKYTLRGDMPSIYDQLQLGSCTANATGAIMQHCQMKEGEAEGTHVPSRLFIYYNERKRGGYPLDQDTGAEVRDGLWVLANMGAPPEELWPYSDANPGPFQMAPGPSVTSNAIQYEAIQYKRIVIGPPGAPMRTAIFNRCPIAFGFPVPATFESSTWNPTAEPLLVPKAGAKFIGGHAVVAIGWDFSCTRFSVPVFEIRNSWNATWGDAGHFYMDYRFFMPWRQLAGDLWVVEKVS